MAGSYIADRPQKAALVEADSVLVGDSTVIGAGSGKRHHPKQSATASSLALRTASGRLKATDAVADDDLVTMKQLKDSESVTMEQVKIVKILALAGVVLP